MDNKSTAICALIFLIVLVIFVIIALWYNPAPIEVVKTTPNRTSADILASVQRNRVNSSMTPTNRVNLETSSNDENNPWKYLQDVDDERVKNRKSYG